MFVLLLLLAYSVLLAGESGAADLEFPGGSIPLKIVPLSAMELNLQVGLHVLLGYTIHILTYYINALLLFHFPVEMKLSD